ncbi:Rossmann-fold NAD(P)-binding domain-containing protein [Roseicella frigidaeris]|uniref:SDR family NAD(P)-dependent oxidoreductase n=1 Tax=Roseicella frigidaeris TaxID=2230885 RepID=A0A327MBJ4_9PROT|nr:SDR family NAD(P)-dependent oxidoreductase [Roseicella frigidaeris]RAI60039.1 SDR family NAD(P)-dependent oxidoreductase [Roseicella frigidaeris]
MTEHDPGRLVVAGLGYSGSAVARDAAAAGWQVTGTARDPARAAPPPGVAVLGFDAAGEAIAAATHLLVTAAPGEAGDPVLAAHAAAIRAAPALRWIGYVSTTGVYGDRGGAWVDEATPPAPGQARSRRRLAAEEAWRAAAAGRALDLFRAAGIYGPGRSAFDDLRAGRARRIGKPGHLFGRIHRDDIAHAVLAALRQAPGPGVRVLHLADDEPAENARVVEEAARLLGLDPPPLVDFAAALPAMSPMARSFWAENRRIGNAATKAALGLAWRYPSYREGLRAILAEEGA